LIFSPITNIAFVLRVSGSFGVDAPWHFAQVFAQQENTNAQVVLLDFVLHPPQGGSRFFGPPIASTVFLFLPPHRAVRPLCPTQTLTRFFAMEKQPQAFFLLRSPPRLPFPTGLFAFGLVVGFFAQTAAVKFPYTPLPRCKSYRLSRSIGLLETLYPCIFYPCELSPQGAPLFCWTPLQTFITDGRAVAVGCFCCISPVSLSSLVIRGCAEFLLFWAGPPLIFRYLPSRRTPSLFFGGGFCIFFLPFGGLLWAKSVVPLSFSRGIFPSWQEVFSFLFGGYPSFDLEPGVLLPVPLPHLACFRASLTVKPFSPFQAGGLDCSTVLTSGRTSCGSGPPLGIVSRSDWTSLFFLFPKIFVFSFWIYSLQIRANLFASKDLCLFFSDFLHPVCNGECSLVFSLFGLMVFHASQCPPF